MAKRNKAESGLDGGEQIRRAAQADEEAARTSGGGQQKTPCPITRAQFKAAPVVTVQFLVNGQVVAAQSATPRTFSTGSLGWYTGDKIEVPVDGVPCKCTVGLNLTVVNSKELPQ